MTHTRFGEFWNGVRATIPMAIGAAPFAIIFGAVAVTGSRPLNPAAAMGMSLVVFAGSAQFIGVGLYGQDVGIAVIVLTTFIVNLRHALYSASLSPYMTHLSQKWLLPLGFWLTDETYALVIARYGQSDESPYKQWYHLGSSVTMYLTWNVCTLIGITAGQAIPDARGWGLEFALTVTFIGIVIPTIRTRPVLVSVVVAGAAALLTYGLPNKLGLMIAALLGIAAGMVAESLSSTSQEAASTT